MSEHHLAALAASGITPEHAAARGYATITESYRLADLKIVKAARDCVPGLLIPLLDVRGSTWGYQYRPDSPRLREGKPVKYETPYQQRNGLDIPPVDTVRDSLGDPSVPLWVTEGTKKADCGVHYQLCIVALSGVWNWRGTNDMGGKTAVADWNDIALSGRRVILAFDGDVVRKRSAAKALCALAEFLKYRGAKVYYLHLPDTDQKTGLDDYLVADHTVEDLWRLVKPNQPPPADDAGELRPTWPESEPEPAQPIPTNEALAVFQRWLHMDDTAPILTVAAAVVANLADGDPVWLLIVGPPSGGKTEILSSCSALPYMVSAATLTEAALLSGTAKRDRAPDATGGLLRQIGGFGVLLAKDFTSVLSQNRDTAKQAMSAMREIYDGRWDRPVGADGGRVLHWHGKCGFIGGVTPSYDRYGSIVNTLGDRYLLLRLPEVDAAKQARAALAQAEHEQQMRAELAAAMTGLIAGADLELVHAPMGGDDTTTLVLLASYAARTRTIVERDGYTGELLVLPQPEGPARLIKALRRVYGALVALGVDADTRWSILARIALDCAPALRVPLMRQLVDTTGSLATKDLAVNVGMVTKTASRVLDDLALLRVIRRTKKTGADNSADLWAATDWLRAHWPETERARQKNTPQRVGAFKEGEEDLYTQVAPSIPLLRTFLSRSGGDASPNGHRADYTAETPATTGGEEGIRK